MNEGQFLPPGIFEAADSRLSTGASLKQRSRDVLPAACALLAGIALWALAVSALKIPIYLLPGPLPVLETLWRHRLVLAADVGITLAEAIFGFLMGAVAGVIVGCSFARSPFLERILGPYFVALQAVPIVATAPLLIVWFGNGLTSKIVLSALVCFFPMVVGTTVGLKRTPPEALDLMSILRASHLQVLWKIRLPFALPYIFSGLRVTSAVSMIGAIVAELAGATLGIGFRIQVASYQFDTPLLFAAILIAAVAGLSLYQSVSLLERRIVPVAATRV